MRGVGVGREYWVKVCAARGGAGVGGTGVEWCLSDLPVDRRRRVHYILHVRLVGEYFPDLPHISHVQETQRWPSTSAHLALTRDRVRAAALDAEVEPRQRQHVLDGGGLGHEQRHPVPKSWTEVENSDKAILEQVPSEVSLMALSCRRPLLDGLGQRTMLLLELGNEAPIRDGEVKHNAILELIDAIWRGLEIET